MKALFLDRDGVINYDYGYVHEKERFEFIDGIFQLVREARSRSYKIIVITNQSGIGRGYYSERDFILVTRWMKSVFLHHSAPIDKVYFSPYHPTKGIGKYKKDHETRKPKIGLITRAKIRLNLSLDKSVLIGDNLTDIQAGISSGVAKNILFSSNKIVHKQHHNFTVINCLYEANKYLID